MRRFGPLQNITPVRRQYPLFVAGILALLLPTATTAEASSYGIFQHGARGVAQVGALVARADDPSAVAYNPAGLAYAVSSGLSLGATALDGSDVYRERFRHGFFVAERPDFVGFSRSDPSLELLPAIYVAWRDEERFGPWSFGLGIDSPFRHEHDWGDGIDSLTLDLRRNALDLRQVHPTVAFGGGDSWSVGGGLRYLWGRHERSTRSTFAPVDSQGEMVPTAVALHHGVDVDGFGYDLGARFRPGGSKVWTLGVVYRSAVEVEGTGAEALRVLEPPTDPVASENLSRVLEGIDGLPFTTSLDLPAELAGGVAFAPLPWLRLEADLVYTVWSRFEERRDGLDFSGNPFPGQALVEGWEDTLSVRGAAEASLGRSFTVAGGVAREPSPLPGERFDSSWFRGDATVYGLGLSFHRGRWHLDAAYARQSSDDSRDELTIPRFGTRSSTWTSEVALSSLSLRRLF